LTLGPGCGSPHDDWPVTVSPSFRGGRGENMAKKVLIYLFLFSNHLSPWVPFFRGSLQPTNFFLYTCSDPNQRTWPLSRVGTQPLVPKRGRFASLRGRVEVGDLVSWSSCAVCCPLPARMHGVLRRKDSRRLSIDALQYQKLVMAAGFCFFPTQFSTITITITIITDPFHVSTKNENRHCRY
jgi:hypothetical protein